MSITLTAYPMAFLVSPEKTKSVSLGILNPKTNNKSFGKKGASDNLRSIRVLSNLNPNSISVLMARLGAVQIKQNLYSVDDIIMVETVPTGATSQFIVSGFSPNIGTKTLQNKGEEFFNKLDKITGENVRLINNSEYFYYNYETTYTSTSEIMESLKLQGNENVYLTPDKEVIADVDEKNVRYYKNDNEEFYTLEVEQKISIVNIGFGGNTSSGNGNLVFSDIEIQTNITHEELKSLLREANYHYYPANGQTPLKNSNATLNWILKDGYYYAQFSGANVQAIKNEAEILFRKMNIAAGRDLRLINEESIITYTYNTNYTDKEMLLNTLIEHGAKNIDESSDEISCNLFGMEMNYIKSDNGSFVLNIKKVTNKSECEDLISDLNEEYGLNIQEMTYNKIKERLEQENLSLESETVLDDNSIVLTIEV